MVPSPFKTKISTFGGWKQLCRFTRIVAFSGDERSHLDVLQLSVTEHDDVDLVNESVLSICWGRSGMMSQEVTRGL